MEAQAQGICSGLALVHLDNFYVVICDFLILTTVIRYEIIQSTINSDSTPRIKLKIRGLLVGTAISGFRCRSWGFCRPDSMSTSFTEGPSFWATLYVIGRRVVEISNNAGVIKTIPV